MVIAIVFERDFFQSLIVNDVRYLGSCMLPCKSYNYKDTPSISIFSSDPNSVSPSRFSSGNPPGAPPRKKNEIKLRGKKFVHAEISDQITPSPFANTPCFSYATATSKNPLPRALEKAAQEGLERSGRR